MSIGRNVAAIRARGWRAVGVALASVTVIAPLVGALAVAQPAVASTAASPLTYGKPVFVDHTRATGDGLGFAEAFDLTAISCVPATTTCVGVDEQGNAVSTTDPTGGTSAWTVLGVDPNFNLSGISCPSTTLCVAVDDDGNVVTTTDPTAMAPVWTITPVDSGHAFEAVACPNTSLCVAVDAAGLAYTVDPSVSVPAWTPKHISNFKIAGVSCASPSLCVAVDQDGDVITSLNPTGGVWTSGKVTGTYALQGVSCEATGSLCAATDFNGGIAVSSNPGGGASTWSETGNVDASSGNGTENGVSCPTAGLCVAVDDAGDLMSSTAPSGTTAAWNVAKQNVGYLAAISCPSASLCVAVGATGSVDWATSPAGAATAWTLVDADGTNNGSGISCPVPSLCVAIDHSGLVTTSTDPTGGPTQWTVDTAADVDTEKRVSVQSPTAVACFSTSLCALADDRGEIFTTSTPTGPASAWASQNTWSNIGIKALACPGPSECVAGDTAGNIISSTDVVGGAVAGWGSTLVDKSASPAIGAISCPTPSFCVAVDWSGNVLTSSNPTGGLASDWTKTNVDSAYEIESVSCPDTNLCVAVDEAGNTIVSSDPTAATPTWTVTQPGFGPLNGVSCASDSLCEAVSVHGQAVATTSPTGGAGAWVATDVDFDREFSGVSCASITLCVALDGAGNVVVGTPAQPTIAVTEVNASAGVPGGGNQVNIYGNGFTGATAVDFGSVAVVPANLAAGFTVINDNDIQAVVPAQGVGPVNVTVTSPLGTSAVTTADVYTYALASPTLNTTPSAAVAVGGQISDAATLANGASPTGSITFNLYAPADTGCTSPIFTSTVGVTNGNATYSTTPYTVTFAAAGPGTYQWAASYSGDSNNSKVSEACKAESVTVTTPVLTITAPNVTSTYGSAAPAMTPSYSGFVLGDTASVLNPAPTCTANTTTTSPPNTYTVSCSGAGDPNYSIVYVPGSLVIGKAPVKISATPAFMSFNPVVFYNWKLNATLVGPLGPIHGEKITFTAGSTALCSANTGSNGTATCTAPASTYQAISNADGYTASFAGDVDYLKASTNAGVTGGETFPLIDSLLGLVIRVLGLVGI